MIDRMYSGMSDVYNAARTALVLTAAVAMLVACSPSDASDLEGRLPKATVTLGEPTILSARLDSEGNLMEIDGDGYVNCVVAPDVYANQHLSSAAGCEGFGSPNDFCLNDSGSL
jgi:hypothetical protein